MKIEISILFILFIGYSFSQNDPKISFNTFTVDMIQGPKYIGDNVFIIGSDSTLYKATVSQMNFQSQNIKVEEIIVDSIDGDLVLFKGLRISGVVTTWRSTDGGNTITQAIWNFPLHGVTPHPTKSGYLLALSKNTAYLSTNFGLEWKTIFTYNLLSYMGVGVPAVWDTTTLNIYAILVMDGKTNMVVTSDFGQSQTVLINNALNMIASYNYIYVGSIGSSYNDLNLNVRNQLSPATTDNGGFLECEFPFGDDIQPNDYRIIDDTSGAIWLGVVLNASSSWGTMFVSDSSGSQYTETMKHVNLDRAYDFTAFYGVPGVYMGNQLLNYKDASDTKPTQVKSMISYDNGGEWTNFTPPADMPCTGQCTLNLHGVSAFIGNLGFGPFYSIPSAPGVAIATGSVGQYLLSTPNLKNIKTFLTNDLGKTWTKIFDSAMIYEFGNFGNFIVAADATKDTNTIYYSIDRGTTWSNYVLTASFDIENIVTAPDNSLMSFIITAEDSNDNGVILTLDFSNFGYPACKSSDLITVSMSDPTPDSSGCILGSQRSYQMRMPNSSCLTATKALLQSNNICPCTVEDFECDLGYIEDPLSSSTQLICALDPNFQGTLSTNPPSNCPSGTQYAVSNGFRKVGGSVCKSGVESQYAPKLLNCPTTSKPKSKGWIAGVVIAILVVIAGGFAFLLYRNPILRERIRKRLGINRGPKYSVVGIKPNSLADEEFGIDDDDAQILNDNEINDNF